MAQYFDTAAAARPLPEVLDFYLRSMQEDFANQEAVHLLGYQLRKKLDDAAKELCGALLDDTENHQVIWAGSATECFRKLPSAELTSQVLPNAPKSPNTKGYVVRERNINNATESKIK